MAPERLPIQFTSDMLGETASVESVFSRLDFVWTNLDIIAVPAGESISLSCSGSLFDFQRAKVAVVLSGQLSCSETSLNYKTGDCFAAFQWFVVTVKAESDTQLAIAQTCANKRALRQANLGTVGGLRRERIPDIRRLSAGELAELLAAFQTGLSGPSQMVFSGLCDRFVLDWRSVFYEQMTQIDRRHRQKTILERFITQSRQALFGHKMLDKQLAHHCLESWLAKGLKLEQPNKTGSSEALPSSPNDTPLLNSTLLSAGLMANVALFDAPIFIVAAPRSGSTMLFEALKENKDFWTIGDESHQVFESVKELHPAANGFDSNSLGAEHLNDGVGRAIVGGFIRRLRTNNGQSFSDLGVDLQPSALRFLEKTPKNALRIRFLKALFPSAKFIFLHRQAEPNIASIMDAWASGKFVTYPNLPNWQGPSWSLLLCPQWQRFNGKPLAEIAAWQWASTNRQILNDLSSFAQQDWCAVSYEQVLLDKAAVFSRLCEFAGVPFGPRMQALATQPLPPSKYTVSMPNNEKWRKHETDIHQAMAQITEVVEVTDRLNALANDR